MGLDRVRELPDLKRVNRWRKELNLIAALLLPLKFEVPCARQFGIHYDKQASKGGEALQAIHFSHMFTPADT
jgi:hypothetical protein